MRMNFDINLDVLWGKFGLIFRLCRSDLRTEDVTHSERERPMLRHNKIDDQARNSDKNPSDSAH